ncbi:MAG: UPF0182 family protein [Acidobacteria bacterium]|jgi:uncharacterized membrane protein (UPF0182 family)|nr:UPF0182 family protein [Acidobacteriota bacterium]
MIIVMSNSDYSDLDAEIINITPKQKRGRGQSKWIILAAMLLLFVALLSSVGIYTEALWFDSLGFASRFWYVFALGWILFAVFGILTFGILRGGFYMLERIFGLDKLAPRKIVINNQPFDVNPSRFLRPLGWILALVFSISYAFGLSSDWQTWMLYLHQPATTTADPIFGNPVGFYLFSLPVYHSIASWLTSLAVILLVATIIYAVLSAVPQQPTMDKKQPGFGGFGMRAYSAVSIALGALLLFIAGQVFLSRYAYLWGDHASFSGVTYTEDNYLIPGLTVVAFALGIAALILFVNAFTKKDGRFIVFALVIPVAVFVVAVFLIPAYVQNFVVKPNELGRETPYIEHNIAGTRAGFNLETVESREYPAETSPAAFNLEANRSTLANIRLWDWRALQDTLRQIQEIRTYYDFPDVDVDRYRIGGEMRQVMIATREFDNSKLPDQSRNWINERLVYTHGYGITMNPVNEFTTEGKPRFILSNMPIESSGEIKVTRPEIYFGERTDTDVYVKTKQREFDYPQGENNNYTNYDGDGGFAIGSGLRRLAIAWETGDLSKLPFSDDVTAESRVLLHRNIADRIKRIAPFLRYDSDPYIVVNDDGRLFWLVDAYTTSNRFPYSRHYDANGQRVNYLRNSVKVTIDAYSGAVNFYVFDETDPIVAAYRRAFPALFKNAEEMPAGLRVHVRYPETLIKTQGDVFGLYHTQSAKMFFGREDVWSIAREAAVNNDANKANSQQQTQPLDPYQVLMPLPGEQSQAEFAQVLPFTPANRNNMIAWMAGRSDGAAYGQLLVYNFPSSRVIDGPSQIEARIDQDAQLSGQITLWNQQGSKVKRGNLIIMPIGTGLLFVEPIYLQAERSPMPELRLVVLATQEKLTYAANFETALTQLLGDAPKANSEDAETKKPQNKNAPQSTNELIKLAAQTFADYQRLTSEGKLGEAGQRLDELKRILGELQNH